MNMSPSITFVIPTFNRKSLVMEEAPRIKALAKFADVVLIDDGSKDDTFAFLTKNFAGICQVTIIRNTTNLGSARCWNIGLDVAKTECVFFLHDDSIELLPSVEQFVKTLKTVISSYEVIGVHVVEEERFHVPFGNAVKEILHPILYALAGQVVSRNYGEPRQCQFVSGILGVKTEIGRLLRFDDKLLVGNGFREESDFELRASRSGFRILYASTIGVNHRRPPKGGQLQKAEGKQYAFWAIRNQLIFMRKNHLIMWVPRYALFIVYQMILHGAPPRVITSAIRDGIRSLLRESGNNLLKKDVQHVPSCRIRYGTCRLSQGQNLE